MFEAPGVREGRSTSLREEGERSEIACKERSGVKAKRSERKRQIGKLAGFAAFGGGGGMRINLEGVVGGMGRRKREF